MNHGFIGHFCTLDVFLSATLAGKADGVDLNVATLSDTKYYPWMASFRRLHV